MTTTTREQAILEAAEARVSGSAHTGLHFPPGNSPFKSASFRSATQIPGGVLGGPLLDPHRVVFGGTSRNGELLIHGADVIIEAYATSSTTGADLTASGSTLDDTTQDFVTAAVAIGDVVIPQVSLWLANSNNYKIYKVVGVAATSLTLDPPVTADESGTVSYVVARLNPARLYTFPDSNETGVAFEEQTFALTEGLFPGSTPSPVAFISQLGGLTGANSVVLPSFPFGLTPTLGDRADAPFLGPGGTATTALPFQHTDAGYRVILYPDDGSGAPDLTKPIVMDQPVIDPAVDIDEQWVHIDPRGFVRLSHPPKSGGDFRPNAEGYTGALRLYGVWYTYETPDASQARGLTAIRPSDSYLLHPSNPGIPANISWFDDLTTGEGFWLIHPALADTTELDHALGVFGDRFDSAAREGRVGIASVRQLTTTGDPQTRVSSLFADIHWNGWLFSDSEDLNGYGAEPGPRTAQITVGDGYHTRGDLWPQTGTGTVAAGGAARVSPEDLESTDLGSTMNDEALRRLRPGGSTGFLPSLNHRHYLGGTLHLRRGIYWVEETIEIPPGVVLKGEGDDTVIKSAPALGDNPLLRVGPPTTSFGGVTPFPDANTEPLCAWTDDRSYDGVALSSTAGDFTGFGCDMVYNARYDRFAVVWTEDVNGAGNHDVFFAEVDVSGNVLTNVGGGGAAPFKISIDTGGSPNVPPTSAGRPRIDWHPLLNTYVIVWEALRGGSTIIAVEFWDAQRDVTLDGRPGNRNGATTGLDLHTAVSGDKLSSMAVQWLWGSQVAGQERRFALSWVNDDGSATVGNNHLDLLVVDVSESTPGDGFDTPTALGANPSTTLALSATFNSCDLAYNGSSDVFHLVFSKNSGANESIHMASFRANATNLTTTLGVGLFSVGFNVALDNVALIIHTNSVDAYATSGPTDFRDVQAVYGHNEIKIIFTDGGSPGRMYHATVQPGYNSNTVGNLSFAWPPDPYVGYGGTNWGSFTDVDDLRGFAYPSLHGGRRGNATGVDSSDMGYPHLSFLGELTAGTLLSLDFDGEDYIAAGIEDTTGDAVISVISGTTGEVISSTSGTLFQGSGAFVENIAIAASPYRFFGVLALSNADSETRFEVASTLRFRTKIKNLRLEGGGSSYQSNRAPFFNYLLQDRDGNRNLTPNDDGFVRRIVSVNETGSNQLVAGASTWTTQDLGKRVVILPGSGSGSVNGDPFSYVITDVVSDTTVTLSPNFPGAVSTGVTVYVGWMFDRRYGGVRMASNGYTTCLAAVTGETFDGTTFGIGGGLHFMMVPNDTLLRDLNGSNDGGICLRREGVVHADVVWTGDMYRVYYLLAPASGGAGKHSFSVERVDISPAGEVIPTMKEPAGPLTGSTDTGPTFSRRVSRFLRDASNTVADEMDVVDFRACYNGKNVAITVYGTDRTVWSGAAGEYQIPFMRYICIPPDFIGSLNDDLTYTYIGVGGGAPHGTNIILADPATTTGADTINSAAGVPIFRPEHVGKQIEIFNAPTPANDGFYTISAVHSATKAEITPPPAATEVVDLRVPRVDHDLTLPEWRSFTGSSHGPDDENLMLGGDLLWNGREFVSVAQFSAGAGSVGRVIWGAFRDSDLRMTRDPTERPSKDGGVSDLAEATFPPVIPAAYINVSGIPWSNVGSPVATPAYFFADPTAGSGVRRTHSWAKYRTAMAYNPIDRIYAIAYVGYYNNSGGGNDPDQDFSQVMIEYFEENGVPLSWAPSDTTADKSERRLLIFGGKQGTPFTGTAADSPVLIWTGSNFALTYRAYRVDESGSPEELVTFEHSPLHILHPKEPGVLHSMEWNTKPNVDQLVTNQDMIFDPVTGDFMLSGVGVAKYNSTGPSMAMWGQDENKQAFLRRLSPKHLIQVAGASHVEIEDVSFRKTPFSVRFDTGVGSDAVTNARIPSKAGYPSAGNPVVNGADPQGMRRIMDSYKLKNLDQEGCLLEARTLDGRGIDDSTGFNINMNGK